jgi:large subunit ribosomal protein L25
MDFINLTVTQRNETGKGPARRLRAEGKIPAIFYGKKAEPVMLTVDLVSLRKLMERAGSNPIFDLKIDSGEGPISRKALLKQKQTRAWDSTLLHLDFLEVFMNEALEVTVPLEFTGQAQALGVEKGGAFQIVVHEMVVLALPDAIPAKITVDISGLDLGQSIHVGEVKLPDGVTAAQEAGIALATITTQKKEEEAEAKAPEEPAAPEK